MKNIELKKQVIFYQKRIFAQEQLHIWLSVDKALHNIYSLQQPREMLHLSSGQEHSPSQFSP